MIRQPKGLRVDKATTQVLGELRLLEGARSPAVLDVDQVDGLERIFEVRLPDDVLAALAARSRQLRETWNLAIERIVDNCERAWRLLYADDEPRAARRDRDWLYAHGPLCLGHRWDGTLLLLPRSCSAEEPTVLRLWRAGEERRRPLVDVLRDEVDQLRLVSESQRIVKGADGSPTAAPPKVIPLAAQRFAPRLIQKPPDETPRTEERRVRHATFGDGTVVAPRGRDVTRDDQRKLAVRFDDGETRVLLSRYVQYLD